MEIQSLNNGLSAVSNYLGIMNTIYRLPRINNDPKIINYGVRHADTECLNGESYAGESAGCNYFWDASILGAIGETLERYAPCFMQKNDFIEGRFSDLNESAIDPNEFALFHTEQFKDYNFSKMVQLFDSETVTKWTKVYDLTNGQMTFLPTQFIYRPLKDDLGLINPTSTTGLAAHTNFYKAILNGLYESIERDSFAITWFQKIIPPKIYISDEIKSLLEQKFNHSYEWHLFDITYDIGVPTTFGFCFGDTEYGRFVAVGASSRFTIEESLNKTIQEIGQSIPYFRYMLEERKDFPPLTKNDLWNFDLHSYYYLEDKNRWKAFDRWRFAKPTKHIPLNKKYTRTSDLEQIKRIISILKSKHYNVLVKDLTTPDLRQLNFFCIRVFIPQLIQLSGAYKLYYLGGKRLYEVPKIMGYKTHNFSELNKDPHPFP